MWNWIHSLNWHWSYWIKADIYIKRWQWPWRHLLLVKYNDNICSVLVEFREHLAEDWVLTVRRGQRSRLRVGRLWMCETLICELIAPLQAEPRPPGAAGLDCWIRIRIQMLHWGKEIGGDGSWVSSGRTETANACFRWSNATRLTREKMKLGKWEP